MDQVAERLAELRERHALTLRELGEMSGVAADTINQIELGHRKARPSTLRKLARALEIDVQEFYAEPALPKAEAPRGAERRPKIVTGAADMTGTGTLRAKGEIRIDLDKLGAILWRVWEKEIGPDEALTEAYSAGDGHS